MVNQGVCNKQTNSKVYVTRVHSIRMMYDLPPARKSNERVLARKIASGKASLTSEISPDASSRKSWEDRVLLEVRGVDGLLFCREEVRPEGESFHELLTPPPPLGVP